MEKAYDTQDLLDRLKDQGFDLAEEALKIVLEEVFDWVEDSAELSENVIDDFVMNIMPLIKSQVFKYVDKIDGEIG